MTMNPIYLTEKDYHRLNHLVQIQRTAHGPHVVDALSKELKRARLVPSEEIPEDVVTMNSRIRLKELKSGAELEISIVYPREADVARKRISVLAPLGTAVLGCKVGDEVKWPAAQHFISYKVEQVVYQPEAAGDLDL